MDVALIFSFVVVTLPSNFAIDITTTLTIILSLKETYLESQCSVLEPRAFILGDRGKIDNKNLPVYPYQIGAHPNFTANRCQVAAWKIICMSLMVQVTEHE